MLFFVKAEHIRTTHSHLIDIGRNTSDINGREHRLKLGKECVTVAGQVTENGHNGVKASANHLPEGCVLISEALLAHLGKVGSTLF